MTNHFRKENYEYYKLFDEEIKKGIFDLKLSPPYYNQRALNILIDKIKKDCER